MLSAVLLHKCSIVHLFPYKKYVCPEREKERKRERKRERERERERESVGLFSDHPNAFVIENDLLR